MKPKLDLDKLLGVQKCPTHNQELLPILGCTTCNEEAVYKSFGIPLSFFNSDVSYTTNPNLFPKKARTSIAKEIDKISNSIANSKRKSNGKK